MKRIFTMIKRNGQWDYIKPVPAAFLSSYFDLETLTDAGFIAAFAPSTLHRPFFISSHVLPRPFSRHPKTKVVEVYIPDEKWNDIEAWKAPHRKWGIDVYDRGWPAKLPQRELEKILDFLDTINFRDYYRAYHGRHRLKLLEKYVQIHKGDDPIVQSSPEQVVLDTIYNLLTYIKDNKFREGHSRRAGIGDFTVAGKWSQIKEVYSIFYRLTTCLMSFDDAVKTRFFSDTIKNHLARSIADFLPFAGGVGVEIATWKVDVEIESPDSIPDNGWAVINFRISGSPEKATLEILIAPVGNVVNDEESRELEYILENDNPPIPQEIQDIIQATEHAIKNTTSVSLPASIFRVLEWRGMPDKRIPLTPSGLARNTIFIKPPFRRRPEIYCSPADVSVWPAWEPQVRSESWWLPNPMFFSPDVADKVVTVLDMTRPYSDWYFRLFRIVPFYCRCADEIRYRVELIRKAIHIFMTPPAS